MRCLAVKRRQAQHNSADRSFLSAAAASPQAAAVLTELRSRSKALLVYAGRLPYRMLGDVYSQLTQMEIEMGCQ